MPVSPPTILRPEVQPIDLDTALRLAGVQNPELNVARQRVLEAVAVRQLAAARFLPSINPGMNYDTHSGNLQQSNGNILSVNRSAVYVGAGSNAVAAGTVNIPGVFLGGNTAVGIFNYLESRQLVRQREFDNIAVRNQVFLRVALAFSELLRSEGRHAVALQAREEAQAIAKLTADYAVTGQGRYADANRAATDLQRREAYIKQVESELSDLLGAALPALEPRSIDPPSPDRRLCCSSPAGPRPDSRRRADRPGPACAGPSWRPSAPRSSRGCCSWTKRRRCHSRRRFTSASAPAVSAAAATWSGRSSAASAAGPISTRSPSGPSRTSASATSP